MPRFLIEVPHESNQVKCARAIVPAAFRPQAKVVQLNAFTKEEIGHFLAQYKE